jgi:ABC-type uncharacterized transport system involved in gliding motility auxiliary subunit
VTSLEKPLKVWIFDDASSEGDRKLLQNYQRFNKEFSFEFVNPDRRPKLVQDFKVQNKGDVFVEYGNKKQLVQNLLSFQQREALSEIQLTNAIEKVKRDKIPQIYFVQGHGELALNNEKSGISEAVTALENKGLGVKPLNLVTDGGIPEEADAVVIAGPERQFLEPEVETLKAYSEAGGNLLVMVSPQTDPGLEKLLDPWGVSFDPRLVVDISGAGNNLGLDPTIPIFNRYGNHPITEKLQGAIAIFPFMRPVATVKKPDIQATTLIEASESMYATQMLSDSLQPNEKTDLLGPFDVAVALEREKSEVKPEKTTSPSPENTPIPPESPNPAENQQSPEEIKPEMKVDQENFPPAKMVVVGGAIFATNAWFNEAVNGDLFLNSVQWLAENVDQPLSIRAKDPTDRRINLGPRRAMVLGWLTWLIVPLIGLALAIWTWWRQR